MVLEKYFLESENVMPTLPFALVLPNISYHLKQSNDLVLFSSSWPIQTPVLPLYSTSLVAHSAVESTGGRKWKAAFVRILSDRLISEGDKSNIWDTQKRIRVRREFLLPLLSNCLGCALAPVPLVMLHTTSEAECSFQKQTSIGNLATSSVPWHWPLKCTVPKKWLTRLLVLRLVTYYEKAPSKNSVALNHR